MITDVPEETPLTTPEAEPTVATDVVPDVHTPPAAASLKVIVEPLQNDVAPVMALTDGERSTVRTAIAFAEPQLLETVYDMVIVPTAIAETTPEDALMVATDASELLHTPPDEVLLNVAEVPVHILDGPEMTLTPGAAFTVTIRNAVDVPQVPDTK